jgi:hypothetical protein
MKIKSLGYPHLIPVGAFDYGWEFHWEENGNWATVRAYRHHLSVTEAWDETAEVRVSKRAINQALRDTSHQRLIELFDNRWTRIPE